MIRPVTLFTAMLGIAPISACVDTASPTSVSEAPQDRGSTLGSSFATAVVINETTEFQGVPAVYKWLEESRPGWKVIGQALAEHNGRPYDLMTISKGGSSEVVYFDISKFFGKI